MSNRCQFFILFLFFSNILCTPVFNDPSNRLEKTRNRDRKIIQAPSELIPRAYDTIPLGSIKAKGWLRQQLLIQARGLSGNLDQPAIWADIGFSQWIGGSAEGWERGPYWLDGFVALAYSLENEEWLEEKVEYWFDYIMANQQKNGMLGPEFPNANLGQGKNPSNDSWPASLVLKAMTQYYEATNDGRVIQSMDRFFTFLNELLSTTPLFSWGAYRWQDLELSIFWLYEQTGQSYLLDLAATVLNQGFDWKTWYTTFPCRTRFSLPECVSVLDSHGVNNAQAIKVGAVTYRITGASDDKNGTSLFMYNLDQYHGSASGVFGSDELLAGKMPSQGTETCLVVEYMFSMETSFSILGDLKYADRLELITFNAMPGSHTEDMWGHQYVQQANQAISRYEPNPVYVSDGPESNMFGIAPNYGCCTANFNQGWPKYVEHMWMTNSSGHLIAVGYGPNELSINLNGTNINIIETTNYPFDPVINFTIVAAQTVDITICFRIPAWAIGATLQIEGSDQVSVNPGELACSNNIWTEGETWVQLVLPFSIRTESRYNNSISIYYGPILLSLAVGQEFYGVSEEELLFEVHNTSAWNFALKISPDTVSQDVKIIPTPFNERCPYCIETPSIIAQVQGRQLLEWDLSQFGAASPPPQSPVNSNEPLVTLMLVPYGGTLLRVTEFPYLSS